METLTESYKTSILVDTSLKTAYDSICKVNDWWGHIEGPTNHVGNEFVYKPGDVRVYFKVTEMISGKKIVWKVTDCHLSWLKDTKEWNGTSVVWNLKQTDKGTEIDFEHVGLAPALECFDGCVKGWDQYVKDSLKSLITEGEGKPGR